MSKIFVSCVTAEFGSYRSRLASDLGSSTIHWITQEQFCQSRFDTIVKLDNEIRECDALVHLVGRGAGATADDAAVSELLDNPHTKVFGDKFIEAIKPFCDVAAAKLSYTHWEVLLAKFRKVPIFVFEASCDVTDGHRDGGPVFVVGTDDPNRMKEHRERLIKIRRYTELFHSYESLKDKVCKTLMSDAHQQIRRLANELKSLARAQDEDAKNREERRARFGTNTVNEVKAILGSFPEVGDPAFLTVACAYLNSSTISWTFPQTWRSPEDDYAIIDYLIDWIAEKDVKETFPALLNLLRKRAEALKYVNAESELSELLQKACAECRVSKIAVEGVCLRARQLEVAATPEAVLRTKFERLPAPGLRRAAIQWPGGIQELDAVGGNTPDSLVEDARNCLGNRAELAVIPVRQIEAFVEPEDVNLPWERRKDSKFHKLPVVLRLERSATELEDLAAPPKIIKKNEVPCLIGHADGLIPRVEQVSFFFAAWTHGKTRDDKVIATLIHCAAVGLWLRDPVGENEAETILNDLDGVDLTELPSRVHTGRVSANPSPWHHAVLLFDRRDGGFPRRPERQRKNYQQLA
jgi:hypothetical protein